MRITPKPAPQVLSGLLESRSALSFVVNMDQERDLVLLVPTGWPWIRICLAPETASELSLQLISRVQDLKRSKR
jgi:hypothetical protein